MYIIIFVLLLIFSSVDSKYPSIAYITYEPICMFNAELYDIPIIVDKFDSMPFNIKYIITTYHSVFRYFYLLIVILMALLNILLLFQT